VTDIKQRTYLLVEVTDGQVDSVPRLYVTRRGAESAFDQCVDGIVNRGVEAIVREPNDPRELIAHVASDDGEQEVLLYSLPVATTPHRGRRREDRPAETVCPDHHRRAKSRMHSGYYCPERLDGGNWCLWEVRSGAR